MGKYLSYFEKEKSIKDLISNIKPVKMTLKDLPQIIEIYKSYWGNEGLYKNIVFEKIINQNLSYVYKIKNKVIAFCLIHYNSKKDLVGIDLLCVKKEFKGNHLGYSLLSFCINNCKNLNHKYFYLHVSPENIAAFNLYKKAGFTVNSFIKNYYKDKNSKNNDAYYMTLNA